MNDCYSISGFSMNRGYKLPTVQEDLDPFHYSIQDELAWFHFIVRWGNILNEDF